MTREIIVLIMWTHQKGSPDSGEGACIRMQGNTSMGAKKELQAWECWGLGFPNPVRYRLEELPRYMQYNPSIHLIFRLLDISILGVIILCFGELPNVCLKCQISCLWVGGPSRKARGRAGRHDTLGAVTAFVLVNFSEVSAPVLELESPICDNALILGGCWGLKVGFIAHFSRQLAKTIWSEGRRGCKLTSI